MVAFLFSIVTFFSTIAGGLFAFKYKDRLHYIISFTAGVLVAVVVFDIVPEIFEIASNLGLSVTPPLIALVVGFMAIHFLEKVAVLHHVHEEEYADHKHPMVGLVSALGLAFHSFLDGVGIGLGFQIDFNVGILITVAVLAHDFCDGLNTVSLMLVNKNTNKKALVLLLIDALAPIFGVLATFVVTISDNMMALYLGFFAGFLLYIGAADLLPEAHSKRSSYRLIGLTALGMIVIFIVTRLLG
jgi:ZIP family zinc transporter